MCTGTRQDRHHNRGDGRLRRIIFTGGVGEDSPEIRSDTCDGLGWMAVAIDEVADGGVGGRGHGHFRPWGAAWDPCRPRRGGNWR